jgi:hypothetical protein
MGSRADRRGFWSRSCCTPESAWTATTAPSPVLLTDRQNTTDFFASLLQRKFATAYTCAHKRARIFHLHHRALYDAVGEPHSRFRKPTPIGVAIERMMVLDAVLSSSGVSWLASERDKLAHFCGLLRARLDQEDFPHITFGNGVRRCVRFFPDKLPIGVVDEGREHIFGYLVTRAAPVDFRAFLLRHAELLRALGRWTLRLWIPGHFREARAAYEWAWKQEFANPLRPSTADELRWYFGQRRERRSAAHDDHERDLKRYSQAQRAFSAPRYRVLYRAWLREGARVIDRRVHPRSPMPSPAGRDALSHTYSPVHISTSLPWLARHEPSSWGDTGRQEVGGLLSPPVVASAGGQTSHEPGPRAVSGATEATQAQWFGDGSRDGA